MSETTKSRGNLILGIAVMFLGILTVAQGVQARELDKDQRQCLADNFGKLTTALTVRGDLNTRDTDNRNRSDESQTQLIVDVFSAKDKTDALQAYADFKKRQAEVKAETKAITKARDEHPYPPFPPGTCDDNLPKPKN